MGHMFLAGLYGTPASLKAMIVYLFVYSVLSIGVFCVLLSIRRLDGTKVGLLTEFTDVVLSRPGLAFVFATFMLSLAGVPPFAGFFGKFYLFYALIELEEYYIAAFIVLINVISTVYYLRVIRFLYFSDTRRHPVTFRPLNSVQKCVLVGVFLFNILFIFVHTPVVLFCLEFALSFFRMLY